MALDRRQLLLNAAAGVVGARSALAAAPGISAVAGGNPTDAALDRLLAQFMETELARSPEQATTLGLDHGAHAAARGKLDERSLAARAADKRTTARELAELRALDRTKLSPARLADYDTMLWTRATQARIDQRFDYGVSGSPYVISQLTGAYQSVPLFLDTQHPIATKEDAEAYLARLNDFAAVLDQELDVLRHDAGLGVVPPDFVIRGALDQMQALIAQPAAQATLVDSLTRRTAAGHIAGDWAARATAIYTAKVVPAVDRQLAALRALQPNAVHAAGVARLPNGQDYYAELLTQYITTRETPADIHRTGLDLVASLSSQLDAAFRVQGMTQGTSGERLRALFADTRFLYPNTDTAKAKLIAELNEKVAAVQARLPQWFGTLPRAHVEIRRVPKAIEAGASSNYQPGSLDGARPGIYYIVLRDTAEDPSWLMPTLTYHESIPGHHLQMTLQQEANLPLIRKTTWFSAYGEGWALYAEQLADEMGMYADDPFGRIGYLHDAQLRAVRLVIDSGLHAMGWSREQAIAYFVANLGDPESAAASEVERYCVWPGQACSYMVGKLTWLKLRAQAKAQLGARFDIRRFHDAGLLSGALPLDLLTQVIGRYVAAT